MSGVNRDILIIGGTGQQGLAAVRELRTAGWGVRVLTRNPRSPAARSAELGGAIVVKGDLADKGALGQAMVSVYGIFCVAPLLRAPPSKDGFLRQFEYVRNVADAAVAAGCQHFVLSSANSADLKINSNLDNKFRMETYIRETGLRATFLRPVSFMENFALPQWGVHQGLFTTALGPDTRQQLIAVDDIAVFARLCLEAPHTSGAETLELAGDELTRDEMAAALSEALGYQVPCLHISTDTLKKLNPQSARTYAMLNDGAMRTVDIAALREIHPGLRTFRDWLQESGVERLRALRPGGSGAYLQQAAAWDVAAATS